MDKEKYIDEKELRALQRNSIELSEAVDIYTEQMPHRLSKPIKKKIKSIIPQAG